MKEERKINKFIQEKDEKKREELLARLHAKYPELNAKPQKKEISFSWRRIAVSVCMACLLICAIVIPSVVFVGGDRSDLPDNNDRFCTADEYSRDYFDYALKQYNAIENKNVLYFDWYDMVLECSTGYYFDTKTKEVLGVFENYVIEKPETIVIISAVNKGVILQEFSEIIEQSRFNTEYIKDISVGWYKSSQDLYGTFFNGEYRYFVSLYYEQDESLLFELIQELFE